MKKLMIIAVMLLGANLLINAQNVTREGKNFTVTASDRAKTQYTDTVTGYAFMNTKGITYPVYKGAKGGLYYWRTSKEGKLYKAYDIPFVIKVAICKELGLPEPIKKEQK